MSTVMNRYPPYPKYKASGVEWLGDVPEGWGVKRISHISNLQSGDAIVSTEIEEQGKYPVYGGNGLRGYSEKFNIDGDYVLIGRQGALCGNINFACGKFWASEHAIVVYPLCPICTKWHRYLLESMNLNQYNVSAAQPGLAVGNINCLKVPFPDLLEQSAIANFLDTQTAKIDTLIAKQQRMIALLGEKRQAVISHAVTKGLNPDAPMKDSGVEWLGDVPRNWDVKKLKYFSKIQTGTTPATSNDDFFSDDGGTLWVKPDDLNGFSPIVTSKKYLTDKGVQVSRLIEANSVLVCGIGTIGKFGVTSIPVTTNQQINAVTFDCSKLLFEYGKYQIAISEKEMSKFANGNVVRILNTESQANIYYPYPPIEEQAAIANHLDTQTTKIDTLISKANQAITLLQERRSALISAAVTGKIDVRAAV